jgi:FdhD protein
MTFDTASSAPRLRWGPAMGLSDGIRTVAEEAPVALVHDGSTTAVMMATPADLEDFGLGFSLSEGLVEASGEIMDLEVVASDLGVEVRMWLSGDRAQALAARRRHLAGPTGCGLCGIESLGEAARPPRPIARNDFTVTGEDLLAAMVAMEAAQRIGPQTRAVHAAGFWRSGEALVVREDVGRHNALDKLIGAVDRGQGSRRGVVLLTSRVSVEMIQKAAVLGAPVVCAVSAPTALAVRTAASSGLTLVAVTRSDGFEIFTHPERVSLADSMTPASFSSAGDAAI